MLVYRLCSREEVEHILNTGDFTTVGSLGVNDGSNTHGYLVDTHYMHFYPLESDVLYRNTCKNSVICTYDIPDDILEMSKGFGTYLDYTNFTRRVEVLEYAVRSSVLTIDYLVKAEVLLDDVDYEDFYGGQLRKGLGYNLYSKNKFTR